MHTGILGEVHTRVVKEFLDMLILIELRERSMSGHDVVSFIKDKFQISISQDTIHSYLNKLERDGLTRGELAQKRTVYTLTTRGRETAEAFLNARDKVLGLVLNLFC